MEEIKTNSSIIDEIKGLYPFIPGSDPAVAEKLTNQLDDEEKLKEIIDQFIILVNEDDEAVVRTLRP